MRTRTRTILAGLALAALLGGGGAWATIPGATGVVQGCYTTSNGSLRVVESADECRNSETAISWNHQGQRGADGKDGAAGPKGDPGAQGVPGRDGAAGAPGARGDACLPSDPACIGPKGDAGAPGRDGAPGAKGEDGAAGMNGTNGVSVTSEAVPAGDVHCPDGGSRFTSASGATYACTGAPGSAGGAGSVAAKGSVRYLAGATGLLAGSRGVASVLLDAAQGLFTVTYATPSPCGPDSQPIAVVSFRFEQSGEIATVAHGANSFTVRTLTPSGAALNTVSNLIDFTFIVAC